MNNKNMLKLAFIAGFLAPEEADSMKRVPIFVISVAFLLCFMATNAHAATNISACGTLNVSGETYLLTADITDSTESTCFYLENDSITFDCQGFTIDGDNSAAGTAINMDIGNTNVTIKNCIITEWTTEGMYINASQSNFYNNTLSVNSIGINTKGVSQSNFYNNTLSNNNDGFYIDGFYNSNISNNTITGNIYDGLNFNEANNNSIYKNTLTNNTLSIVLGTNDHDNKFYENNVSNNSQASVEIVIIPENIFPLNNTIYNNLFYNNTAEFYICKYDASIYTCNDTFPISYVPLNFFNTTQQAGTRIYSNGTQIGGNYWTNSTGNGYSDTCTDANTDGFCDDAYDVEANAACAAVADGLPACGNNTDWLPLSALYAREEQTELNATTNVTTGCCPISTYECVDNVTLRQLWNTSDGISWAVETCENGCDNTTMACAPPTYQQNLIIFGVIMAMVIIMLVLVRLRRR